ncbi:hypothetical protein [Microbacterium sp. G2-8]|uniref:hypothetical protein n=1 Tax=Microbacterium sp. G2-8 TaxID=2842454 RepID=UPI001C8A0A65|nr:hypothetical protein [Microbacterium sp. G2-8]
MTRARRRFLDILGRAPNPLTLRAAHSGRGPFSLIEHVGRTSRRVYEVPLILAPVEGGFITELTYGTNVNWLRNIEKAGGRIRPRYRDSASPRRPRGASDRP